MPCRAEGQAGQRVTPPQGRRGLHLAQVFPAATLLYRGGNDKLREVSFWHWERDCSHQTVH